MSDYKTVNSRGKEIFTNVTVHPGEILNRELKSRGIKKSAFAAEVGLRPGHFSELLTGKRRLSPAIALKLEKILAIPAEFWMRVQGYHDLFVERGNAVPQQNVTSE